MEAQNLTSDQFTTFSDIFYQVLNQIVAYDPQHIKPELFINLICGCFEVDAIRDIKVQLGVLPEILSEIRSFFQKNETNEKTENETNEKTETGTNETEIVMTIEYFVKFVKNCFVELMTEKRNNFNLQVSPEYIQHLIKRFKMTNKSLPTFAIFFIDALKTIIDRLSYIKYVPAYDIVAASKSYKKRKLKKKNETAPTNQPTEEPTKPKRSKRLKSEKIVV